MPTRLLIPALALLATGLGICSPARGEDALIVTLTDRSDRSNQVATRCPIANPCSATLALRFGAIKADLTFAMGAGEDTIHVHTVDWREAEWHFVLARDGGGNDFPQGKSTGTLWLLWTNGVQNPVLRSQQGIKAASIQVSVERETTTKPAPLESLDGASGAPM